MPFILIFLQYCLYTLRKVRVYFSKPDRNILVHGAFTYSVNFCGAPYRRIIIYYIFSEYNTSFTFRIRYRYCSGFHKIAPFIRRHGLSQPCISFAQIYAVKGENMITPYLPRYGVTVCRKTSIVDKNGVSLIACSVGFASCKTFGKQPKHPCFGAKPPTGTRGGSPSNIAPARMPGVYAQRLCTMQSQQSIHSPSPREGVWGFGKDADIERPKALQDAKPTKRS